MSEEILFNFNKGKFAKLLERAMGDRSLNQYAMNCGVSPTYISKLLRGLVEEPPGAKIIKKFSNKAQNGISYYQLMDAAGLIDLKDFYTNEAAESRSKYEINTLAAHREDNPLSKLPPKALKSLEDAIKHIQEAEWDEEPKE